MNLTLVPLALLGLEGVGSTLFGIVSVVLGIGLLIFIHELGHFLAAKWAGVKVEVFSLGMGRRIFGFTRGDTDYRVSLLPIGGYVKMLGQDDADPDQPRTESPGDFRNKSVGARMVILSAGVVMNALLAVVLFILAFAIGVDFLAPEVGSITAGSAAEKAQVVGDADAPRGLRRGDQILAIDGKEILAFEDIQTLVALSGETLSVEVERTTKDGPKRLAFIARPQRDDDDSIPRLGITPPDYVATAPAGSALRETDQIVGIAPIGSQVRETRPSEIDAWCTDHPGEKAKLLVLRQTFDADGRPVGREELEVEVTIAAIPEWDLGLEIHDEARVRAVTSESPARGKLEVGDTIVSLAGRAATATNLIPLIAQVGEASKDPANPRKGKPVPIVIRRRAGATETETTIDVALDWRPTPETPWFLGVKFGADRVKAVEPGSPAATAGIEPGDRLSAFKTRKLLGLFWRGAQEATRDELARLLFSQRDVPFQLAWEHGGETKKAVIAARKSARVRGELTGLELRQRTVFIRRGILPAVSLGVNRTLRNTEQLLLTLRALVTRKVSARELGGPIKIAEVTYKHAQVGVGKLLYILALLSVNLAVLNVLPIPLLDGGHLFLLAIEKLKGRPLSDNVLVYTQWVGLFLILGLMVAVTFNDIRGLFQ